MGTVVDVGDDRIVGTRVISQQIGDVPDHDRHARIDERGLGERGEESAVPLDHLRDQFGDDHLGVFADVVERGSERETHPEPADQHARGWLSTELLARQMSELLLRRGRAAVHQLPVADEDREDLAVLVEAELRTGCELVVLSR